MMLVQAILALSMPIQQAVPPPPPAPPSGAAPARRLQVESDDIVVEGLKDIDSPGSAVTSATLGSSRVGSSVASRAALSLATRFARCTLARKSDPQALRNALDGRINSSRQAFAQGRLIQANVSCVQDTAAVTSTADTRDVRATYATGYDGSYYDRGALFIEVLKTYAPDLRLTSAETGDPVVQARFNARETPLARFRLPVDMTYFETAVCFVRVQPRLSVQLVKTDKAADISRVEAAIVNRARVCVGGARKVYFDPSQFRFYIADAVYRWAVAAKGVDSLIPAG